MFQSTAGCLDRLLQSRGFRTGKILYIKHLHCQDMAHNLSFCWNSNIMRAEVHTELLQSCMTSAANQRIRLSQRKYAFFVHLPNTNSVSLFCEKNAILTKRPFFFTTTPKTLFSGFSLKVSFSICFIFLFWFFQHKKTKTKHFFFSETLFWHPDKLPKNIFAPLHTICVLLRHPKNTMKLGKNKHAKILDRFSTQETPNLGQIFSSTTDIERKREK